MISKSDYKIYLESPRHFWALKNNQYYDDISDFDKQLITNGYDVEQTAKEYIYKHISNNYEYQKNLVYKDLECIVDFFVYDKKEGAYYIYEVKSSTKLSDKYINDLGFQYIVASKLFKISKLNIIHLDSEYIMDDKLDLAGLFRVQDITLKVLERVKQIEKDIENMRLISDMNDFSNLDICYKPKTCPCKDLCFPNLKNDSIYKLANIHRSALKELNRLNISNMLDIPNDFKLGKRQKLQILSLRNKQPIINIEGIRNELGKLKYPLFFLDYEAFSWAIPRYRGHKVYQKIVFQYSLHKLENESKEPIHYEYISQNKDDISREIIPQLLKDIQTEGTIIVWNKAFEKECNREMARLYPEYKNSLLDLNNRIYDLGDIFSKQYYVDYRFNGSWSIKNVLPVIVPNLNYKNLKGVHDGSEAMQGWYDLVFSEIDNKEERKDQLLRYCELDTYAMVKIYQYLASIL